MRIIKETIFIPKRIRVGFQNRDDTYTKKLAYVIYYDEKGKLRKEASWESWRDKQIEPVEYDNVPTEGFVLNKKVGGYVSDWIGFRQAYVRVYDPRGFEFEISVPNLLYILEHTSSIKGKGLEGEFIYGWDGTELLLLPICSPDYKRLSELSQKRNEQGFIKAKDLKIGAKYLTKQGKHWIYMGRFDTYDDCYEFDGQTFTSYRKMEHYAYSKKLDLYSYGWPREYYYKDIQMCVGKQFFFWDGKYFEHMPSISNRLIDVVTEDPDPDYAKIFEKLEETTTYSPIDHSKDVVRPCTQEECQIFQDVRYNLDYMTVINGHPIELTICSADNQFPHEKFRVRHQDGSIPTEIVELFDFEQTYKPYHIAREMKPVSIEEILKVLPPYCRELYLQNGKYYGKEFVR